MATRARMCDVEELRVTAAFEPCRVHLPPFPPPKAPPRCSVSLVARAIRRLCPRLNFRGLPVRVTSRQRAWCIGGCVQSYGGSQSHRVSERLIRTRCARRPLVPCCQSRRSARRFWRPLTDTTASRQPSSRSETTFSRGSPQTATSAQSTGNGRFSTCTVKSVCSLVTHPSALALGLGRRTLRRRSEPSPRH